MVYGPLGKRRGVFYGNNQEPCFLCQINDHLYLY